MNIDHVTNAIRAGHLTTSNTKKLIFVPDSTRSKDELCNNAGRVYFLTIDGIIVKIGGSQCKGGIKGTIGWYLNGFAPKNSPRTYCVWNYMYQALNEGKSVEFYFISSKIITETIPTMNGFIQTQIPLDYHQIEHACVNEYVAIEGTHPFLNMQESGGKWENTGLLEGFINLDGSVHNTK
jgi:hypothetical protein